MITFSQYITETFSLNNPHTDIDGLAQKYGYKRSNYTTSKNHDSYTHPLGHSIHKWIDPKAHMSTWTHFDPQGKVLDRGEAHHAARDLQSSLHAAHPKRSDYAVTKHNTDDF